MTGSKGSLGLVVLMMSAKGGCSTPVSIGTDYAGGAAGAAAGGRTSVGGQDVRPPSSGGANGGSNGGSVAVGGAVPSGGRADGVGGNVGGAGGGDQAGSTASGAAGRDGAGGSTSGGLGGIAGAAGAPAGGAADAGATGSSGAGGGAIGTCPTALPLKCGDRLNHSTVTEGRASQWNGYNLSARAENGRETLYAFQTANRCRVVANLKNLTTDLDLFLLSRCEQESNVRSNEAASSTPLDLQTVESVSWTNSAGAIHYVVVDGYAGDEGSYTLEVDCTCD
ncbi:MAG TPA: hypothetical protein VFQ35_24710 [Polyangiaceae bacterium]|nr:hypothetical protein [Polyangiaceae bacterium]